MTPFSGFKIMTLEGGTRAPLVIRYPGEVTMGARTGAFVYVLDIVPTLLDLAGVAPQSDKDKTALSGRSMVPVLTDSTKEIYGSNDVIATEIAGNVAVYRGDYKLVRNLPPYGDKEWHLYNLKLDPTEVNDIAAANPDVAKSMRAAYADYVKRYGVVEVLDNYSVVDQAKRNMMRGEH